MFRAASLMTPSLKKGGALRLPWVLAGDVDWTARRGFKEALATACAASLPLNPPRAVRCAAANLECAGAVVAAPAHHLLSSLRTKIIALRHVWRISLIPRSGRSEQRRQPAGCRQQLLGGSRHLGLFQAR